MKFKSFRREVGVQSGVTLVELMVALTVSLVLVLAAVALYSSSSSSQRSLDELSAANEAGAVALRTIGRDLGNAGFWPTARSETGDENTASSYFNPMGASQLAYQAGVYGCEGATLNMATGVCNAKVDGDPDSLVVSYFTNDSFGTEVGQRADCEGNDSAGAPVNLSRVGTGLSTQPPARPLFVSNSYQLRAGETTAVNGNSTTTRSLACKGNGTAGTDGTQVVPGIQDVQLTYGVFSDRTRVPTNFYAADRVQPLGDVTIDGTALSAWQRVVAVRVCVIARTFQTAVAINASASTPTYQDCDGNVVTNAIGDASLRKTYVQVFGVRNRQTATY
jgi:type IV pilus assembly protein PilW